MKQDFKKSISAYKAKAGEFAVIDVPAMQYLMIDGDGGPEATSFAEAIQTLYPVAYALKFMSKIELDRDYVVPPLEALWWAQDMTSFTTAYDNTQWQWTAMIMTPDWICAARLEPLLDAVRSKKNPPAMDKLRLETLTESRCMQTLHLGPFSDEAPVLQHMHETLIPGMNAQMCGKHHEIYFNDFRKVDPAKLRTILRQPIC